MSTIPGTPTPATIPTPAPEAPARAAAPTPAAAPSPTGGALLAVAALCGGAGASTLALLVARSATGRCESPVLLCDVGGPCAGLSLYAGLVAPRSLAGAAGLIAAGEPLVGGMFAEDGAGLRLLAGGPELEPAAAAGLTRLLTDARQAHELTVVDCGTLRTAAEREVLAAATHVAWVVPATLSGVRRGRRMVELFGLDQDRQEILVARHDRAGRRAPTKELSVLAATRDAPLVLMPDVPDLGEGDEQRALDAAALTIDALWSVIRR